MDVELTKAEMRRIIQDDPIAKHFGAESPARAEIFNQLIATAATRKALTWAVAHFGADMYHRKALITWLIDEGMEPWPEGGTQC